MLHKYTIGDQVQYNGQMGTIIQRSIHKDGRTYYDIVLNENNRLICAAREDEIRTKQLAS